MSALCSLRQEQQTRAQSFNSRYNLASSPDLKCFENLLPLSDQYLRAHRQRILEASAGMEPQSSYYGSLESVSLLDTLPLFIALSAAQNVLEGNSVTELWMRLAARYMTEAALEQYLVYGASETKVLHQAFAYGFHFGSSAEPQKGDLEIMNLFWGGNGMEEVSKWQDIRNEHLRAVS